jgi:hypothetical protein
MKSARDLPIHAANLLMSISAGDHGPSTFAAP